MIGYDETAFGKNLFYDQLDPQLACEIFEKNRQLTTEILRRLPAAAFERVGHHNERGTVTLTDLLETYADHLDHHLKFIRDKRARMRSTGQTVGSLLRTTCGTLRWPGGSIWIVMWSMREAIVQHAAQGVERRVALRGRRPARRGPRAIPCRW